MSHAIHVGHATTRHLRRAMTALAALLLAAVPGPLPPHDAQAANQGIVTAQGGQFVLNGAPFRFVGTNAYYLHTTAASGSYVQTDETMSVMSGLGMKVLRVWAFGDGASYGQALQPAPGVYDEENFRALDYVLYKADQAGIRLIMVLVNHWGEFGGMPQYVQWCAPGQSVDVFYTNPTCRDLYKRYASQVLNRVNTYNGRPYKTDPTIFAWELANEPGMTDGADASGQTVRNWVAEMAAHLKAIDPNHMVGTGEEGYDTTSSGYSPISQYNNQGYLFNGWKGVSFTQNTALPDIDFGSIHLYPEYWNFPASSGATWVADHIRIARNLGKPLLFGEFGHSTNAGPTYDSWLGAFEANQGGGALVWQLMCPSCAPWRDQFGIVYPPTGAVSDVLARYAALANAGSGGAPPPPPAEPTFTIGTTAVAPNPVRRNRTLGIDTTVTTDAAAGGIIVDIEVYTSAGQRVAQQAYSGQSFTPGQTRAYHWNWRANVTPGTYTVKVGVFSAGWAELYSWNNQAATVTVVPR